MFALTARLPAPSTEGTNGARLGGKAKKPKLV